MSAILFLPPPPRIRPSHREHQVFQSCAGVLSGHHGLRCRECGREGLVFIFCPHSFLLLSASCFCVYTTPPKQRFVLLASLIYPFVLFLSMPRHKNLPVMPSIYIYVHPVITRSGGGGGRVLVQPGRGTNDPRNGRTSIGQGGGVRGRLVPIVYLPEVMSTLFRGTNKQENNHIVIHSTIIFTVRYFARGTMPRVRDAALGPHTSIHFLR